MFRLWGLRSELYCLDELLRSMSLPPGAQGDYVLGNSGSACETRLGDFGSKTLPLDNRSEHPDISPVSSKSTLRSSEPKDDRKT